MAVDWRIQYYFYSAGEIKGKLIVIKEGLKEPDYKKRKAVAQKIIKELLILLEKEGYNPVTVTKYIIKETSSSPFMRLAQATDLALKEIKVTHDTRLDIRSMVKYFNQAAFQLGLATIPLSAIKRKHIKQILEHLSKTRNLSAMRYNKYRTYLMILFNYLVDIEAIESNFIKEIKKQQEEIKIRETLTLTERKQVNDHLKKNHYNFWRFLQIFYHSGGRISELLEVKASSVNLINQRYKVTVRKGRQHKQIWRPIKNNVLYLWKEILEQSAANDFIFYENLVPGSGEKPIRREQITRRWKTHVKDKLGITADFYSLKHLNLDETAAMLDINDAAAMAGHSTPVVTLKHYAQGEVLRQEERLKKVNNSFS
jgi:site-specific recombinase XerD